MNCPYCDMFSTDNKVCIHCGEKLPHSPEQNTKPPSRADGSSFGRVFGLIVLAGILCGAALFFYLNREDVPGYMIEGPLNIANKIVPGQITIIDFYSDYCPPCRQIAPWLKKLDHSDPEVTVVKININRSGIKNIDWQSPIVKQFNIKSIPYFLVFDQNGKLMYKEKKAWNYIQKKLQTISM